MSKTLLVSSQVQANLLNKFLLNEIVNGFWKTQRPLTHGDAWKDVVVQVTDTNQVGPINGFTPVRFYDFINPEFTKIHESTLVSLAQEVKPGMKFKTLKKELIELARIIGGRMTDKTQEPARVFRGNNRADYAVVRTVDHQKVLTVAGAKALVEGAVNTVKKTVVKKPVEVDGVKRTAVKKVVAEDGVTTMTTAAGATVRKVAVKKSETV
jgi:hypothetical protein